MRYLKKKIILAFLDVSFSGILDYLHGTDRVFRSSNLYKRHIVSFKKEPVRTQFPDETNND